MGQGLTTGAWQGETAWGPAVRLPGIGLPGIRRRFQPPVPPARLPGRRPRHPSHPGVPDVSADASGQTGMAIVLSDDGRSMVRNSGGTSASAGYRLGQPRRAGSHPAARTLRGALTSGPQCPGPAVPPGPVPSLYRPFGDPQIVRDLADPVAAVEPLSCLQPQQLTPPATRQGCTRSAYRIPSYARSQPTSRT